MSRQTCGPCHDIDLIANGFHHQQGRTDENSDVIVRDNYFNDGRSYVRSAGMYGKGGPPSSDSSQLAAKTNSDPKQIDKSSYFWTGQCAICHPGGGPGEFAGDEHLIHGGVLPHAAFRLADLPEKPKSST